MSCSEQETKKYCCSRRSSLPCDRLVVRIEHLAQVLGDDLLVDGAVVVAAIEDGEVERLRRFGFPQAQRVRGVDAVAEDRRVVGHAVHDLVPAPSARAVRPCSSVIVLGAAAELHFHRPLRPRDLPGIAEAQPLVGLLHLPAVDDLLLEDAELVADAVADRRDLQRRQRIEEAGGEAAEAAVAEAGLVFVREQLVEVEADLGRPPARTSSYMPRLTRLLPRCGPIRNSADR